MEKVYRCPKGCTVSNRDGRCPRCGQWMRYDGKQTKEEAQEKTTQIQLDKIRNLRT